MRRIKNSTKWWIECNLKFFLAIFVCTTLISCNNSSLSDFSETSTAKSNKTDINTSSPKKLTKVDVATANLSSLSNQKQYRGTTQPKKQVSWRSQTEGILLELPVKIGDRVSKGQLIGKLDDLILATDVAGKKGELAALKSELAQAKIQVTNAQIKLDESQIQLAQAKNDAVRYQNLAQTGIIPQQQAQSFQTAARVAQKAVLTAEEAIKLEEQAVAIIEGRITTQESAISESQQRQNYSRITAPISGIVISKTKDPGSLIRAGEEVVAVGDFSQIKIVVPLSELDLGKVSVGQQVRVKLDAFGDREFSGEVSRIAPTTNSSSRQIPVEVVIDNPENKIKGGLLTRVSFSSAQESRIVVPEVAVIEEDGANYIFTVTKEDKNNQSNANKRKVIIGDSP